MSKISEKNSKDKIIFNTTSDKNHLFSFTIQISNNSIIFSALYQEDNNNEHYFENIMSLEKLKKDKYFFFYENIQEIYDELKYLINKNNLKIKEEIDKIFISIATDDRKFKEIVFIIFENKYYLNTNCDTENSKEEIENNESFEFKEVEQINDNEDDEEDEENEEEDEEKGDYSLIEIPKEMDIKDIIFKLNKKVSDNEGKNIEEDINFKKYEKIFEKDKDFFKKEILFLLQKQNIFYQQ